MSNEMPGYRAFHATVVRTRRLSPAFVRITFTGPELASFGYAGHDQRLKLLIPQPGRTLADLPTGEDWYPRWRALDEGIRPVMRTYTVRDFRPGGEQAELDVDFVLHGVGDASGAAGPMSRWAATARPGDPVAMMGPDRPGRGRMWGAEWAPPADAGHVLLAGDETALPAIGVILASLPDGVAATVCAELPDEGDIPAWELAPAVDVSWLVRRGRPRGAALHSAVEQALRHLCTPSGRPGSDPLDRPEDDVLLWDIPDEPAGGAAGPYVWMAGEAGVMRELRRLARGDFALPRSSVACMGYWREGRSEAA